MKQIHEYTIKLLRYVLNEDIPQLPTVIDFEQLYAFSKSHGIENMIYIGLRDLKIEVPEPTMKKFKEAYEMAIMVEAMQALELEAISNAFEEAGIDHVPLKGSVIKYLYPMPDYRKSGDIDILIKPKDENKIDLVMKSLGYKLGHPDIHEVHISYVKLPFLEIEIHRRLTRLEDRSRKFCDQAWEYVICKDKYEHWYEMNTEYLYMSLLAHLCKHLYISGAGIRLITDIYVLKKALPIDEKKLVSYLKKANLYSLNIMLSGLIEKWFYDADNNDNDVNALEKIVLAGGSFGSSVTEGILKGSSSRKEKIALFFERLFPSSEMMRGRYDKFNETHYPWIYMWCYRMYDLINNKRSLVNHRVQETFTNNLDNINSSKEFEKLAKAVRSKLW